MKPRFVIVTVLLLALSVSVQIMASDQPHHAQIKNLKVTVLSTMVVGDRVGLGEWGFSALLEADGHRKCISTVIEEPGDNRCHEFQIGGQGDC